LIQRSETRLKRIYAYSLLILFLGYFACITLFYHSHVVFGETISHSHPYKTDKNGAPLHSHSDKGYITIHLLSCITLIFAIFNFIPKPEDHVLSEITPASNTGLDVIPFHFIYSLRGPPSEMLS
jgi:hypothetical protein